MEFVLVLNKFNENEDRKGDNKMGGGGEYFFVYGIFDYWIKYINLYWII